MVLRPSFEASKIWSGRRESDPRPTAWKAVTLPLSYSRPGYTKNLELMMGLEPMTSPLPRECSTTELHQPSCAFRSSSRARMFAITTRNANSPRNKIGSHRTWTSRSSKPTYRLENPCTCITAAGSMVNHDSKPKTTKPPRAMNMRPRSAAGLSDGSLSLIAIHHANLTTRSSKNGAQGRIRTSVTRRVADLQSAAINHSATCALCLASSPFRNSPPLPMPSPARWFSHELFSQDCGWRTLQGWNNWQVQPTSTFNQLHAAAPENSGAGEGI